MATFALKWSSLFNMPEIEFEGAFPSKITVEEDIQITLAWLTAADRTERKLVRCDSLGGLLFSDAWNGFNPVETGEITVSNSTEDVITFTVANQGVLVSTGANLLQLFFKRVASGDDEEVYIPGLSTFWFPHPVYSVRARCVPYVSGGYSVHGVTAYN